jgi:subfamily B ATP-binding cassette protein MsbA
MFTRLWGKYLRKHIAWIAVALVLMVIEGSTLGVLSYMLQPMFDTVFVEGRGDAIMWVGLGIFGLFIVRAVTSVAQRIIMTRIGTAKRSVGACHEPRQRVLSNQPARRSD